MAPEKHTIIFRADGNHSIGMGHFVRTLALADILSEQFHCVFALREPSSYQLGEIKKVCQQYINLPDDDSHFDVFMDMLNGNEIVVLDNYYFSTGYQQAIKDKGCKLVCIEDLADRHFVCDALINNTPGYSKSDFSVEPYTKIYLGNDYALLRKEFLKPEWRKVPKIKNRIFISFGGADVHNISHKIVTFLHKISPNFHITLLVGDAYLHMDTLTAFSSLNVFKNIPAANIAQLMAESEVCVITSSGLLNETSSVGSKVVLGYVAENQLVAYNDYVEKELVIGTGNFLDVDFETFKKSFETARNSEQLIQNQFKKYRMQQIDNLTNVFLSILNDSNRTT